MESGARFGRLERTKKIKLVTAAAMGAIAVTGELLERYGDVKGMPFPMHDLKHPWLGYWGGWIGSRIAGRFGKKTEIAGGVTAAVGADFAAETLQNMKNGLAPGQWFSPGARHGSFDDLSADLLAYGLLMAQNYGVRNMIAPIASLKTDLFQKAQATESVPGMEPHRLQTFEDDNCGQSLPEPGWQ